MVVTDQGAYDSHHSNDPIMENVLSPSEHSISKETYEVRPACEVLGNTATSEDDYPDGGLRAWLIVAGVRHR